MAKRRIEVDIVANDQASSVFSNVRTNATNLSTSLMSALGGTVNAVGSIDSALRTYNASMYRFNRVVGSVVRAAGDSILNFTKDAINNFSALEQQHAKTMGAMATEYDKTASAQRKFLEDSEKLKQQALTLGTTGPGGRGALNTVNDVSYAQTALIKSGLSANDLLNTNAIESILKFAGGNDLSIDEATTFAVNLGTVFNKPVEQWGEMLDMVTKAADISVIDVPDIMDSLTYTGGIASGLNRDLSEVLGVISIMGQAGLRGRVAGTGLQAFFTRILSAGELSDTQIGNAPTEYVGQMYNAFVAESVNDDGSFKDMDEVASLLNTAMESLNDQEQAWFAKKLFGLYQMKAAYALTGSVDGDENLITDFINQIENQSEGTNDIKYELMLASQYGKLESLKNAWEGIKTDVGGDLSPVTSAVADELFNFLGNKGNYEINWDRLREALSESGDLIGENYGQELANAIESFGNFGIDAGLITSALTPQVGGILSGIGKLLNGDISGALDEFKNGIDATNDNIEELPPELRDTAEAASGVITAFATLSSINLATQILQIITTAFNTFIGKPINILKSIITSTSATTTASTGTVTVGTATAVNIGTVPLMNVTATVVNVYGNGFGNNNGNPFGNGGNGTPLLPGGNGGGGSLLPWIIGSGGGLAAGKLLPGATGSIPLLPGAVGSGAAGAVGKTITMYNIGGTYMSASQIATMIAGKAALGGLALASIPIFGSPGLLQSEDKRAQGGSDWIDKYVAEGNSDYAEIIRNANVEYWARNHSNYNGSNGNSLVEAEMVGRTAAREEMMAYYQTGAGASFLNELFAAQIAENGKITEDFLTAVTQWTKDGYTYTGSNDDIKAILNFMYSNFDTDYKDSLNYSGRFNNTAIDKFLKGDNELNTFTATDVGNITDGMTSMIDNINKAADRLQSPNINVNVTTNVDRSGIATSNVDIGSASREFARRSSRYGQIAMDR